MPVAVNFDPLWIACGVGLLAMLGTSMFTYILSSPIWRKGKR